MSKAAELAALIGSQTALSNRNLIINGAMNVAQRGTVTGAVQDSFGGPDRYKISESSATVFTMSQDSDTPTGEGFANSLKLDVTTADSSLAATDFVSVLYNIEGQDLQSIKKGTSSAESVTLSFYIKSTITGTYVVQLYDNDNNRSVSKSYTVSSADTWEKKTLTFPADTTGAFDSDNALSLLIRWWFAAGNDYASGTLATSWESYNVANAAVGQVNAVNSASNNILITGVQLEVGEQATPFEHRSFGDELARCQRYFQTYVNPMLDGLVPNNASRVYDAGLIFQPEMRSAPVAYISNTGSSNGQGIYDGETSAYVTSLLSQGSTQYGVELNFNVSTDLANYRPASFTGGGSTSNQTTYNFDAEL